MLRDLKPEPSMTFQTSRDAVNIGLESIQVMSVLCGDSLS